VRVPERTQIKRLSATDAGKSPIVTQQSYQTIVKKPIAEFTPERPPGTIADPLQMYIHCPALCMLALVWASQNQERFGGFPVGI
jgi:hypothetical protein